jgi:hypothetical protein
MKTVLCLALVLLTSCSTSSISLPLIYNRDCPHVCWLGINPGVTTAVEARGLLRSSNQIDQTSYKEDPSGFTVEWMSRPKSEPTAVGLSVENGLVKTIYLNSFGTLRMQDVIGLLGEPEEISLSKVVAPDSIYTDYIVYFTSAKAIAFVMAMGKDGPASENYVDVLFLNLDASDPGAPKWVLQHNQFRQPWLGFGNLKEYLTNRP